MPASISEVPRFGDLVVVGSPPEPSANQVAQVANLLGRRPEGEFRVKVATTDGSPVVIQNAPFTASGRPMPTTYWLVDSDLVRVVSQIESDGGVSAAEKAVDAIQLRELHARYARQRDELISPSHDGPRPSGGVGGTRKGVKCLHAHLAHYLATGDDVVGEWTAQQLRDMSIGRRLV